MRRHKEAIEVAREATTRFPLTPRTWTDLADAASAGNDKETELNALRQAIRLNPNWGYAARRLADAIVHTDNRDEAQKALERALLADPRDPLVRMRLADIFDENDQKEKAIEQYRIAALYSPTNDQAWQKLIDVSADVDLGATAVAAGREITKRRPLDARAWLRLAETLNRVEDREEAYQIIERAIERNSQLVDAYDLKARYLAHDGDIEKAIEVCQAAILAGQVSPMLLWRQSTLLHDAGQTTKAIESMKQMLQIDPTIFRGWSNLCNWSQDVGQWSTFETAAAKMIELNPHSPVGFGYMSIALLRNSKRAEAIEHLEKSIEIEPSYSYAADELIRLYIEDRDFARANLILVKCARAFTVGELESARAQIAFASGDQERGIKLLEDLDAAIPGRVWLDSFHWLVQRALSDIASKISKSTMEQLLQRMSSPDCRAVYGLAWGNLASTSSSIFSQHARAIEKLPDSPAWQAAVKTLVRMCNKREYREEFQKFVRILRRRIIQNESLYIEVGERLLRQPFDMDNAALKWCRPMLEQPKFPIAGLETLITAAWEAAPIRQAMQLTRQAVARPDADTTDFLPVARVIERIYSNDFLGGVEAVKMVHEERAREWHFDYYRTALLLMKLMDPACPNPREAFEQVIRAMDKFCTEGSIHQGFVDMRFKHRVLYIAHRRMKHPFKAAYHFILSHRRDRT